MNIIPIDRPRLNLKFYTKIFEYFLLDIKDYSAVLTCLKKYPSYLINHDYLLEVCKKQIEENP